MRVFHVSGEQFVELDALPEALPARLPLDRRGAPRVRGQRLDAAGAAGAGTGGTLVDLHVSDLLNNQLPSHFDATSGYDLLVFRRLAAGAGTAGSFLDEEHGTATLPRRASAIDAIDTSPVGFAVRPRAAHRAPHRLHGARLLRVAHGAAGGSQR